MKSPIRFPFGHRGLNTVSNREYPDRNLSYRRLFGKGFEAMRQAALPETEALLSNNSTPEIYGRNCQGGRGCVRSASGLKPIGL
jgi:hypothetical protein